MLGVVFDCKIVECGWGTSTESENYWNFRGQSGADCLEPVEVSSTPSTTNFDAGEVGRIAEEGGRALMNKPKLKDIRITKDNYLDLLKIGDKVWVEEEGNCVATVTGFDHDSNLLTVRVTGRCAIWPWLKNIYMIDESGDSGCDVLTNESICKECQKRALKKRIKKLQKKLEKLQEQLEGM